ncbi:hypothetical protein HU200_045021 [Digitaria exilis]|uniref:Uncharacterized protein n=1 Tax=Digitaria exilis TaxID=1010633 RepID=A0A835B6N4_9POAL|nr:hypothetical protein HU200_045021 [Digitaria exilis]
MLYALDCELLANSRGKISLISQNSQKRRLEKNGADDGNDEHIGSPVAMDGKVGKGGNHNKERKKKRTKVQEAQQNREEEEMRQLESSLFGTLHAPLELATRYAADGVDDLPIYKEDLVHGDEEDGVVIKGRKPVWVDEEEERTEVNIVKVARLRKLRKEAEEH